MQQGSSTSHLAPQFAIRVVQRGDEGIQVTCSAQQSLLPHTRVIAVSDMASKDLGVQITCEDIFSYIQNTAWVLGKESPYHHWRGPPGLTQSP